MYFQIPPMLWIPSNFEVFVSKIILVILFSSKHIMAVCLLMFNFFTFRSYKFGITCGIFSYFSLYVNETDIAV